MKPFLRLLFSLLVIAGAGYAVYAWLGTRQHASQPAPAPRQSPTQPIASPSIQYPVPAESVPSPPASEPPSSSKPGGLSRPVDQSDESVSEALIGLFGRDRFDSLFISKDLIRRTVVTIDNLGRARQPAQDLWPVRGPQGDFVAAGKGDTFSISQRNYRRYDPYVSLLRTVNLSKLVGIYRHFYPLFQAAYQDLGTQGYFNDRVVAVIDRLLQAPDLVGAVKLVPGIHGIFHYADPAVESLSAGQKILIRMGFDNEQRVKSWLRKLRARLTHFSSAARPGR